MTLPAAGGPIEVASSSRPGHTYTVTGYTTAQPACTCPAGVQGALCKHAAAVLLSMGQTPHQIVRTYGTLAGVPAAEAPSAVSDAACHRGVSMAVVPTVALTAPQPLSIQAERERCQEQLAAICKQLAAFPSQITQKSNRFGLVLARHALAGCGALLDKLHTLHTRLAEGPEEALDPAAPLRQVQDGVGNSRRRLKSCMEGGRRRGLKKQPAAAEAGTAAQETALAAPWKELPGKRKRQGVEDVSGQLPSNSYDQKQQRSLSNSRSG